MAGAGLGGGGAPARQLAAAALARRALRLCGRCWAHCTNWNVQTADCDVTKGPARLASPAGGAVANPRLRIPPPHPLHDSLASGSCPGARLRASGGLPGRPLPGASTPCRRATHRPLNEKGPQSLRDPHLPAFAAYMPAPSPILLSPVSFHRHPLALSPNLYPFVNSTPRPCTSILPTNLLPALPPSSVSAPHPYTFSAFPLCFSSAGHA